MLNKHHLHDMLEPVISALGYEVVRIITIGAENVTLQVMIDRKDGKEITVDDCAKVSRALSEVLDEKDPIENNYTLEVSSPGLDRPLTKLEHFERFIGYEAKVEALQIIKERKRFKGKLLGVEDGNIKIETDGEEYVIPFDEVSKAKLVLTDELLKAYEQDFDLNLENNEE